MNNLIEKGVFFYKKHREVLNYLVFGGLTTLINIIVFALCFDLISMSTVLSNCIAWVVAVIFAFVTNKLWVFESKSFEIKVIIREAGGFFAARLLTLALDTGIAYLFIDILGFHYLLIKILSNIVVIILNYIFSKLFVFIKKTSDKEDTKNEANEEDNKT